MKVNTEILPKEKFLLGLSGGADSIALAHFLKKEGYDFVALHVNHMLNENANSWAEYCRTFCEKYNIEYIEQTVHVSKEKNLENNARKERYSIFRSSGFKNLVLAHHLDDQAETFFLKFFRGGGVIGLGCMKPVKELKENDGLNPITVIRPLLKTNKESIIWYCNDFGLHYIVDPSNLDNSFNRNFLRNVIITKITEKFSSFYHAIEKSIDNLQNAENCLNDLAEIDLEKYLDKNTNEISIEKIQKSPIPAYRLANMIYFFLKKKEYTPSHDDLVSFSKSLLSISYNNKIEIYAKNDQGKTIKLKQKGKILFLSE